MSNDTKYFLIPASSGLCIQPGYNKTETANVEGNDNQLWQIEQGKSNKIAFRNVNSGQYLRATGGYNSNAVDAGSRQWWVLETSDTPNGYWIKCDAYPKAYLCNSYGYIKPNNTIYMWAKDEYWKQSMIWYICDHDSWLKHKKMKSSLQFLSASSGGQDNGELEKKLKETEEKQVELEQKLKAAEDQQKEFEQNDKERREELKKKETELETKSEAALAKEKELEEREQALVEKERSGSQTKDLNSESNEKELLSLQDQVASLKSDAEKLQAENSKLRSKEADLARLQQAYDNLQRNGGGDDFRTAGAAGSGSIVGSRLQNGSKEMEAAQVGLRANPPGLRTRDPRPTTTRGRLAPIQLQQGFSSIPRLRAN